MAHHGVYPHDIVPPTSKYYDSGRFGRMFGELPAFSSDTPETRASLLEIGKAGGLMDAKDKLSEGPVKLITDAPLSASTYGWTDDRHCSFFWMWHDIPTRALNSASCQ